MVYTIETRNITERMKFNGFRLLNLLTKTYQGS